MNPLSLPLSGNESFWALLGSLSTDKILTYSQLNDVGPLYSLTLSAVFTVFGNSESILRLVSVVSLLITAFAVFRLTDNLWNTKSAVVASVLTFTNPLLLGFALEGSPISFMLAIISLSISFFLTRFWLGYIISTILMLYSTPIGLYVVASETIISCIWLYKKLTEEVKDYLKSLLIIALFCVPAFYYFANKGSFSLASLFIEPGNLGEIFSLGIENSILRLLAYIILFVVLIFRFRNTEKFISLLFLIIVPIFAYSLFPLGHAKLLSFTVFGVIAIVSGNIQKYSLFLLSLLAVLFLLADYNLLKTNNDTSLFDLKSYLTEFKKGDDLILFKNIDPQSAWQFSYYQVPGRLLVPRGSDLPSWQEELKDFLPPSIMEIPKGTYRIGIISTSSIEEQKFDSYTKEGKKQFGKYSLTWFSK